MTGEPLVLNEFFDGILNELREELSHEDGGRQGIPDFDEKFSYSGFLGSISAEVRGREGWVQVSDVRRSGDVVLQVSDDKIFLTAALTANGLPFGYRQCCIKVPNLFQTTENLHATADRIAVEAKVYTLPENDKVQLEYIRVSDFGGINLHTGGGFLNQIMDSLLDLIVNHFRSDIVACINRALEGAVQKALSNGFEFKL